MTGTLGLVSLSRLKTVPVDDYTCKLLIVREPGKVEYSKYGLIHTPHLSPSPTLFGTYQTRWKHNTYNTEELKLLGKMTNGTWWDLYVPQFTLEMTNRTDMKRALSRVEDLLNQGDNVLFVCFCKDETHCHRGILGTYFENKGFKLEHY